MKHEVLFLNNRRAYVLVSDTWYDTPADFAPKPGQSFLAGRIEEVLDYQAYQEKYPDSKDEIYPYVSDKTMTGGYIRRVVDGNVRYGVNPEAPVLRTKSEGEYIN
jgi:hypothetical protein